MEVWSKGGHKFSAVYIDKQYVRKHTKGNNVFALFVACSRRPFNRTPSNPSPFEGNPMCDLNLGMTSFYTALIVLAGLMTILIGSGAGTFLSLIYMGLNLRQEVRWCEGYMFQHASMFVEHLQLLTKSPASVTQIQRSVSNTYCPDLYINTHLQYANVCSQLYCNLGCWSLIIHWICVLHVYTTLYTWDSQKNQCVHADG